MTVEGKVAAITGASSGLGAEVARQLASTGWRVALIARRAVELGEVVNLIRREGGYALMAPADVSDREATAAAIRRVERVVGPVDLLVANAGIARPFSADEFDVLAFRQMIEVNLMGVVHAIEGVLPSMASRGTGQVVGISSLAGYRGVRGASGYSASKAALTTMLEGLRPEMGRLGIHISIVHPGFVRTPMTEAQLSPKPLMMDVETAAKIILTGIGRRSPRIDFPWPMVAALRLFRLLPDRIYDAIGERLAINSRPKG